MADRSQIAPGGSRDSSILILAIFVAGLCSIIYELLISTASSYFLGDSVKQFSLTIGLYMASMGAGAWLSRLLRHDLIRRFILLEIGLGFLGGISVPLLYLCYAAAPDAYPVVMVSLSLGVGLLIGFEIPLLTRILERYYSLKINISTVLSVDYLGALIATLLFPFLLLPIFGTFRSSLLIGLFNLSLGIVMLVAFGRRECRHHRRRLGALNVAAVIGLALLLIFSHTLTGFWSQSLYSDQIVFDRQSRHQRIVLTRYADDTRLFLDGNLQFSSRDEYRYHELLVHLPLAAAPRHERVLILGGGDGLAARELLRYRSVREITIADLDPEVTRLARENPLISELNQHSLEDPRVTLRHVDAMHFLADSERRFDVILSDLPDPNNVSLSRLYSREFFNLVASRLDPGGVFAIQSTSPYHARTAFWSIGATLQASAFTHILPYHADIPSFGTWGFHLVSQSPLDPAQLQLPSFPLRYLTADLLPALFHFPPDMARPSQGVVVNTLDDPDLMHAYLKGWNYWR